MPRSGHTHASPSPAPTYASNEPDEAFLSVITLDEIRRGIELHRTKDAKTAGAHERWLLGLESHYAEKVLSITSSVADRWGRLSPTSRCRPPTASDGLRRPNRGDGPGAQAQRRDAQCHQFPALLGQHAQSIHLRQHSPGRPALRPFAGSVGSLPPAAAYRPASPSTAPTRLPPANARWPIGPRPVRLRPSRGPGGTPWRALIAAPACPSPII